ncbi:MAG: DUF547 domain-containing protein [Thermoleophilia bacterium]|nr:DUF547 domain-containing protein [Thermoleophilia bacterium]
MPGTEQNSINGERNEPPAARPDGGFAGEIQDSIEMLFERFVATDGMAVDYKALHNSAEFRDYELEVRKLADFDPTELELREERLALWINLYNMTVLQKVGTLDAAASVKDVKGFFSRNACSLGGMDYSLDDIEHGILRDNAREPGRPWRKWRSWDARRHSAVYPLEPRVCFALTRASSSGPALRFYDVAGIEGQLYQAAKGFILNGGVTIEIERNTISMSQIFRDYSADFGGGQGVLKFIANHMEPEDAALIRSRAGAMKVKYHTLARELNSAS